MSYSLLITLSFFWAQSVLLSQGLYDELLKNSILASLLGSVMIVFLLFTLLSRASLCRCQLSGQLVEH